MKRKAVIIAALVLVAIVACACGGTPTASTADWKLTVSGPNVQKTFTMADLEAMPSEQVKYTAKELGTENSYTCVALRTILEEAGIDLAAVQSVEIDAEDAYMAKYGRDLAVDGKAYLAIRMDGKPLPTDMGTARSLVPGQEGKMQVKFVKSITAK